MHAKYNQKQYLQYAKQTHPIVIPKGIKKVKEDTFYKLPDRPIPSHATSVSLVPPGSHVLQYKKEQSKKHLTRHNKHATLGKTTTGENQLILAMNVKKAWIVVGKALRKSKTYQILDKDKTMHSYYILDTTATNNKITQSTPIYRLSIQEDGKQADVNIADQKNQSVASKDAMRILSAVKHHLS